MGSTDDLDDYDAELELRLKREYADVFPIFSFCVVTDEATYLCNQLEIDCVPHASYLLFELDMRDVWVWDRNRPTRIIPRAHVFTTGDVTVEQLRGEEGELERALPAGVLDQLRMRLEVEAAMEGADDLLPEVAEDLEDELVEPTDAPGGPEASTGADGSPS